MICLIPASLDGNWPSICAGDGLHGRQGAQELQWCFLGPLQVRRLHTMNRTTTRVEQKSEGRHERLVSKGSLRGRGTSGCSIDVDFHNEVDDGSGGHDDDGNVGDYDGDNVNVMVVVVMMVMLKMRMVIVMVMVIKNMDDCERDGGGVDGGGVDGGGVDGGGHNDDDDQDDDDDENGGGSGCSD